MMTVSPYGIFQAQEARHYTLAIFRVIASVSCLVIATRRLPVVAVGEAGGLFGAFRGIHGQDGRSLPVWLTAS